ncbi:MAG: glycosyltransferase [Brevinematales bacterium]|jgi:cellulose synthase/poly-beta-1,6-N-acetylglucosamine synthase-like glycosyltransferase
MKEKKKAVLPLKFGYLKSSSLLIKIINIFGLLSSLFMLSGLLIIGLSNLVYLLIFSPLVLVFLFYYSTHYIFNLFYDRFSIENHKTFIENYWNGINAASGPSVDILIPYSGEGISIVRQTCLAALNMDYGNKKVFLLDDAGDDDVKKVMEEMGVNYLRRADIGHMRKGGNLSHGVKMTNGEFIAIFDADFIPERDFLRDLLPYFSDTGVGLVQSPQYFSSEGPGIVRNLLTSGGAALQEDFYKVIQPSRNPFHGAICVGTNLIYRRSSLEAAGGIAYVPWCEDLETGFNITANGNRILYLPLILAKGRSPDNPQSYFNQHRRWCYSSMRLLFSKKMFGSKMELTTRLSYLSNIFYYFSEAFSILAVLVFTLIMIFAPSLIDTRYFIFFMPYLFFLIVLQPAMRKSKINPGSFISSTLESFAYLYTMIVMLFTRELIWIPSNMKQSKITLHFILFSIMTGLIVAVEAFNIYNALFLNLKTITFRQWTTYVFIGWLSLIIITQAFLFLYIAAFLIRTFLFKPGKGSREV